MISSANIKKLHDDAFEGTELEHGADLLFISFEFTVLGNQMTGKNELCNISMGVWIQHSNREA